MKNTTLASLVASLAAIVALALSNYTTAVELKATKEIKAKELLDMIDERSERREMYTKNEDETLPEPSGMQSADVLERIDMLNQHLNCSPSPEWIRDVIAAAELEIKDLRVPNF